MYNYIYRVTERNVDGCGGDATEFVLFHKPLDRVLSALFAHCLRDAKENTGEDVDTSEMISSALSQFVEESGIEGRITKAPYEKTLDRKSVV